MYLLLADIHGDVSALQKILRSLKNETFDAALLAGDITSGEGFDKVKAIYDTLLKVAKKILAVPGNWDGIKAREAMDSLGINIDGKTYLIGGYYVVGFEGERFVEELGTYVPHYEGIDTILSKLPAERTILLTHYPPRDTEADKLWTGHHVGSIIVRNLVVEFQPLLVVCGHIHEAQSVDTLGASTIVNPGAASEGNFAIFDNSSREVRVYERFGKLRFTLSLRRFQ